MRLITAAFVAMGALGACPGCSESTGGDTVAIGGDAGQTTSVPGWSSPDGSVPRDASSEAAGDSGGDGAAACSTVRQLGKPVAMALLGADPPPAIGGPIANGIYVLTAYEVYTGVGGPSGPTGDTIAATWVVIDSTYWSVTTESGSTEEIRTSGSFAAIGPSLSVAQACPFASSGTGPFTSDGVRSFVLYFPGDGGTTRITLTKQ